MARPKPTFYVTDRMREYRTGRQWTQAELAEFLTLELGRPIGRASVVQWEKGNRGIASDLAVEMARVINVPINQLVEQR